MIEPRDWKWFGKPGHFVGSFMCYFHLVTQVGPWFISTIGEYWPYARPRPCVPATDDFEDIGYNRKYETMVFGSGPPCDADGCKCEMPLPVAYNEIEMKGYNDPAAASHGHFALCLKYSDLRPLETQQSLGGDHGLDQA